MTTVPVSETRKASRGRLILARVFVVLAVVVGMVSLFSGYVRWQVLDTPTFNKTAGQLIASDPIRQQVAGILADQLYANVDVESELAAQLPAGQKGLAAPLAGALRQLADRSAYELLGRPRVQAIFVLAATQAERQAKRALDNDLTAADVRDGYIVLDLRPVVIELGKQFSFLGDLDQRLPPDAGVVKIAQADQFETAQQVTRVFRAVAFVLPFIVILLAGIGIWLARGRRRREVRAFGIGAVAIGLALLVLRDLAGRYVVDALATSTAAEPAAKDVWSILTQLLADGAWTSVILGVAVLAGVWLTAPSGLGAAKRHALAPILARRLTGYGLVFGLYLLLLLWQPTVQFGRWLTIAIFAVLLALGYETLRRLVLREEPGAAQADAADRLRGLLPRRWGSSGNLAGQLEQLGALRDNGTLTEADFAAAKARLLAHSGT
jgi:Short C-terminal domain